MGVRVLGRIVLVATKLLLCVLFIGFIHVSTTDRATAAGVKLPDCTGSKCSKNLYEVYRKEQGQKFWVFWQCQHNPATGGATPTSVHCNQNDILKMSCTNTENACLCTFLDGAQHAKIGMTVCCDSEENCKGSASIPI